MRKPIIKSQTTSPGKPIAEDVARGMVREWADYLEIDLTEEVISGILPSVMRGKVSFDQDTETFTLLLRKPIELGNGKLLESITLEEPDAQSLKKAVKSRDDMDTAIRMISVMTGQPVGVIDRLKQRDLTAASGIISFFS